MFDVLACARASPSLFLNMDRNQKEWEGSGSASDHVNADPR